MPEVHMAVHGHFYQPPRESPWTEEVPVEPSAAPHHDWNARITAESYRPNAFARIVDDHGLVLAIVNNYGLLSFNVGPTLASWLERREPETYARIIAADRLRGTAVAQAYNHQILPLASPRDLRTQIRWGLADFRHRFGRRAEGLWLPETAVNDEVLAALIDEGVDFTILGAHQAAEPVVAGEAYRWEHPDGSGRSLALVFFDGPLSHDVAFGLASRSADALLDRAEAAARHGGLVLVATDGETFGHHHPFTERAVAYALGVGAPRRHLGTGPLSAWLRRHPPTRTIAVRESAWSCAHGVGRWKEDCGCSTGGRPGSNQAWRAPLRAALDLVRDRAAAVFERRGKEVLRDPWAARDAYIHVILGDTEPLAFVAAHGWPGADPVECLTLLELQRQCQLMYTSCGWFFHDLAGIETIQVLQYAARALDLVAELGEPDPTSGVLDVLATARSNDPREGTGRDLWATHVAPARVGPERVVAHLALLELLEGTSPDRVVGGYEVTVEHHRRLERGAAALSAGRVALVHRRTGRAHHFAYAAVHLGGLEVVGASRPSTGAVEDDAAVDDLAAHWGAGERISAVLRELVERFGPEEFGLAAALPGVERRILERTASRLRERFSADLDRLLDDHRRSLTALAEAGYPLPAELRLPIELTLARHLRDDLVALAERHDTGALASAAHTVTDAVEAGVHLALPDVQVAATAALEAVVARAVAERSRSSVLLAEGLLDLLATAGIEASLDRPQEDVYAALTAGDVPPLAELGRRLGLGVGRLGVPR